MADIAAPRTPWSWVPSLYFAQGIPYVIANTVSVIMFKRLGISNTDIALYTSWLNLPWVLKPLWSPFVDIFRTKRYWIVALQFFLGVCMASVALTLPSPQFFQYSLAMFWLIAFSSATHDIAADGFYMLGLETHQQAAFAGVRNTFYRIATITAQGGLVILAGQIERVSGLPPVDLLVKAGPNVAVVTSQSTNADTAPEGGEPRLVVSRVEAGIPTSPQPQSDIAARLKSAKEANLVGGFIAAEKKLTTQKAEPGVWAGISEKTGAFIKSHFGEAPREKSKVAGNIEVVHVRLSQPPAEDKDVVVTVTHKSGDDDLSVIEGSRLTFNRRNWNQEASIVVQLDPKRREAADAHFSIAAGNTIFAWIACFGVMAVLLGAVGTYHALMLPRPPADVTVRRGGVLHEFFHTFVIFFRKPGIGKIIAFLLFYRFAEAQLVKLVTPFLLDSREAGGLGLTTSELGLVYGTIGIICLMVGGLAGGYVVAQHGLRRWLWPMVFIIHLPDLAFVFLAYMQPTNMALIGAAIAIEQFGYGFGFTAYMLFMILVAQGEHKTAHYALCTGFMALGMMLPGMLSGWLQELIGYRHFFIWVSLSTIPGFIVAALANIDPEFGRKKVNSFLITKEREHETRGRKG